MRRVIEEETEVLGKKPLCSPPSQNDPLVNKIGVQGYHSNLIYPMYLNSLSFSSQWTSSIPVFTSYPDLAISSKLHLPINDFFQCFLYAPKLLSTLRLDEVSVWVKNLSRMCMWSSRVRAGRGSRSSTAGPVGGLCMSSSGSAFRGHMRGSILA